MSAVQESVHDLQPDLVVADKSGFPETQIPGEIVHHSNGLQVLTGLSNPQLGLEIGKLLNIKIQQPVTIFADGERRVVIKDSLRRQDVIIIQSTAPAEFTYSHEGYVQTHSVNDNLMELFVMIDAAKRASAAEITAVIPYFAYARQDRKDQPRTSITAALIAKMLKTAGCDRIVTMDLHADQEQGFFDGPWDSLYSSSVLIPAIKSFDKIDSTNLVAVSPDRGGVTRVTAWAKRLGTDKIAVVYKQRDFNLNDQTETLYFIGDVAGRDVLQIDDILSTGSSIFGAADLLSRNGARKVYAAVAHGLFLKDALQKLERSPVEKIYVTDTVQHRKEVVQHPKIQVVSTAPLFADAIMRIHLGRSLSPDLFA